MFLKACRNFGMKEVDTFQTQDLYEAKAMFSVRKKKYIKNKINYSILILLQVINCLYSLGSLVSIFNFTSCLFVFVSRLLYMYL